MGHKNSKGHKNSTPPKRGRPVFPKRRAKWPKLQFVPFEVNVTPPTPKDVLGESPLPVGVSARDRVYNALRHIYSAQELARWGERTEDDSDFSAAVCAGIAALLEKAVAELDRPGVFQ